MPSDGELDLLKTRILEQWRRKVSEDAAAEPWTDGELEDAATRMGAEELAQLKSGEMLYVPYGSTLIAGFATDGFWTGLQIGDGFLVTMDAEGDYLWPMPESRVNQGNRTASLCMGDPMPEFRHCLGTDPIIGLAVCTDGIEKAFPPMGEKVTSFLHWLWLAAREDPEQAQRLLASYTERVATRSATKDDVGIAVMADTQALDVLPRPTKQQMDREMHQAAAQLEELQNVISYTRKQLLGAGSLDEAEQLQQILDRRMAEQSILQKKLEEGYGAEQTDDVSAGGPGALPPAAAGCQPGADQGQE